jgi:hypothetical protein
MTQELAEEQGLAVVSLRGLVSGGAQLEARPLVAIDHRQQNDYTERQDWCGMIDKKLAQLELQR